tara:strand:- start:10421 stop:10807 length:387 start_codon:yes stop_codon:yes gene_type:complete
MKYVYFVLAALALLAGCASPNSSDSPLDNAGYRSALEQQRQGARSVTVYKQVPADAIGVRPVMAAFCSSNPRMTGNDENYILTGLKLEAYALTYNAIADVNIQDIQDPNSRCRGATIGGTAKAFSTRH